MFWKGRGERGLHVIAALIAPRAKWNFHTDTPLGVPSALDNRISKANYIDIDNSSGEVFHSVSKSTFDNRITVIKSIEFSVVTSILRRFREVQLCAC